MSAACNVGEHIFTGLSGPRLEPEEIRLIKRFRPAGFVLFGRNVKNPAQVKSLCASIYELYSSFSESRVPAIAVDHEGWPVDRFARLIGSMPGNPMLGSAGSVELARKQGALMARDLSCLGININFAPVLDLLTTDSPPVVAFRSLSASASVVSRIGAGLIRGMMENGVGVCAKHFPGIGDCPVDPHYHVPFMSYGTEVFERPQIEPFREAFCAGAEMLMVGHVSGAFGTHGRTELSTCSKAFLSAIRKKLGFSGLLVSDDMHMRALTDMFGPEEACLRALGAGMDILLMCRPIKEQEKVLAGLERKFQKRPLSLNRGRMNKFFASLSKPLKVKRAGRTERRKLIDDICRKGLKPEIFNDIGHVSKVGAVFIRPRYQSFPGASRIYWDGFLEGLKNGGIKTGLRINLFPRVGENNERKDRARIEKTLSSFRKGDFVILCWDGVYGKWLLEGLIDSLSIKGCRVGVVSIAKTTLEQDYRPKICFRLCALSGLKCALELSGRIISGILKA